ncbi:MAG TPA: hypothetical protein VJH04_03455 [archaeon]|nr:hypothetical protein [archaeon]
MKKVSSKNQNKIEKHNIMDFAGAWNMSDEEAKKLKERLKKVRSSWKTIRYKHMFS